MVVDSPKMVAYDQDGVWTTRMVVYAPRMVVYDQDGVQTIIMVVDNNLSEFTV